MKIDNYTASFKYHSLGRCVIPSGGGDKGKKALVKWEPYQDRQSTEDEIQGWQKQLNPALWAMVTGRVSGLFVIDNDSSEELTKMMVAEGIKPHSRTPRGGSHYYVKHPGFPIKTMTDIMPGVDIRGEGGYVNFTGRTSDGVYEILQYPTNESLIPFERLPQILRDRLTKESPDYEGNIATPTPTKGSTTPVEHPSGLADKLLKRYTESTKSGTRNETGLTLACQLRDNHFSQEDASPIMLQYANAVRDLPGDNGAHSPYTEKEALLTLASAYSKPAREPWANPLDEVNQSVVQNSAGGKMHSDNVTTHSDVSSPEEKATAVNFHYTDMGNAERLVWRFGKILHYCEERQMWLIWNGKSWEWDSGVKVKSLAKLVIRRYYAEAASIDGEDKRTALLDHARKSEGEQRVNAMISLARIEPNILIESDKLDSHPWLLNCFNGTLDLRTGILHPHSKGDLLTQCLTTNYDPNALCPQFNRFIDRIVGNCVELARYLQNAIGYSLAGSIREQVLFFLFGPGSNGKTTLTNLIQLLLEHYARHIDIEVLTFKEYGSSGTSEGLANLNGKRVVFTTETTEGRRLNEGMVKNMVGGDPISVSRKYEHEITFLPTHKLWMFGNHKPAIRDTTLGMWRKIRLLPFTVTIPKDEQDGNLPDKLATELPGILAWAVRGCLEWQKYGLGEPPQVTNATADYRKEQDIVASFIAECCDLGDNEDCTIAELYEAYTKYCLDNGDVSLTKRFFVRKVVEKGIDRAEGAHNVKMFHRISLKDTGFVTGFVTPNTPKKDEEKSSERLPSY